MGSSRPRLRALWRYTWGVVHLFVCDLAQVQFFGLVYQLGVVGEEDCVHAVFSHLPVVRRVRDLILRLIVLPCQPVDERAVVDFAFVCHAHQAHGGLGWRLLDEGIVGLVD